jgi:hypothetical protein
MSFYKFGSDDIINTIMVTYPAQFIEQHGTITTGSVYLEKKYLNSSLLNRRFEGYSDKEGGFVADTGPFSSSFDMVSATRTGLNSGYFSVIERLCTYYGTFNNNYTTTFSGTVENSIRIINIPEIFYDKEILSQSLVLTYADTTGTIGRLYDDGFGNICSSGAAGIATGSAVGRVFYEEGIIFVRDSGSLTNFGLPSATSSFKISFNGVHRIPTKIFRCRAPVGQLNASTNPTFYRISSVANAAFRNEKEIVMDDKKTYITTIGLYNEEYKLVGLAKLAQPIKKEYNADLLFRIRLDM